MNKENKTIFEMPKVEITVFDIEDVITTSSGSTTGGGSTGGGFEGEWDMFD